MSIFNNLFAALCAPKVSQVGIGGLASQGEGPGGSSGSETLPARLKLEERMAFRRELLYETIRASLKSSFIAANTYRFKVMRTDKRGHCFVVMLDMSPTFMASPAGQHLSLSETAAVLVKNAKIKHGLQVGGVYWRSDETLDVSVANWARPTVPVPPAPSPQSQRQSNIETFEAITAEEMAEFEAAWQKVSAIQIGERTSLTDSASALEDPQQK